MKQGRPEIVADKRNREITVGEHTMTWHDAKEVAHEILDKINHGECWPEKRGGK